MQVNQVEELRSEIRSRLICPDGGNSSESGEEVRGDRSDCNVVNTNGLTSCLESMVTNPYQIDSEYDSEQDKNGVGEHHHDENADADH